MANPFSPEINKVVFQALLFMENAFDVITDEADDDEDKIDEYWKVETDPEDGGPAAFVTIDFRGKGKKDPYADVTLLFPQPGCADTLPLWINVLREDAEDEYDDLKAEFAEAKADDEEMRLGFEWPVGADATDAQIKEAGRKFGARIAKALWE